jgi:hypothetical protein
MVHREEEPCNCLRKMDQPKTVLMLKKQAVLHNDLLLLLLLLLLLYYTGLPFKPLLSTRNPINSFIIPIPIFPPDVTLLPVM